MRKQTRSIWIRCAATVVFCAPLLSELLSGPEVSRYSALSYEVVDGWVVHAGDMVLGPAEELVGPDGRIRKGVQDAPPLRRRDISAGSSTPLWPRGMIPYVIDPDFSAATREDIRAAIEAWNSNTLITLYPRTTERDYLRFRTTTERCRSHVGRVGGEQSIWWVQAGGACGDKTFLMHEIGHTVGLWHEHQRTDRDLYLTVREEGISEAGRSWIVTADHPADGPYDFASVMHYHPRAHSRDGLPVMETVPPGIAIRSSEEGLSAGDIHGVATLYGLPPWATTITTNPPGLDIVVNGRRVATPATRYWRHGIIKSLRAPSPQVEGESRYVFARWNTDRAREHNLTVGEHGTWLEANFIVQHTVSVSTSPESAGSVTVTPPSADGFYTLRTPVQARAHPKPGSGLSFWKWTLWRSHGLAADPATVLLRNPEHFEASFAAEPLFRISSTAGPFVLHVNGEPMVGPVALHRGEHGDFVEVSVPAEQVRPASRYRPSRYLFQGWTDGGPRTRRVDLRRGGELVAILGTDYYLDSGVGSTSDRGEGVGSAPPDGGPRGVGGPAGSAGPAAAAFGTSAQPSVGRLLSPSALTFVAPGKADAAPQEVTLTNPRSGPVWYRFDQRTPWLTAEPREGVLQANESVTIVVRTHSAGIAPDTYAREFPIRLTDAAGQSVAEPTVRVAFAVVPPSGRSDR